MWKTSEEPLVEHLQEGFLQEIQNMIEVLKSVLPEELKSLKYETVVMRTVEVKKKKKSYRYLVLEAFLDRKSKKVLSFPYGQAPVKEIKKIVYAYRAAKGLDYALDYLSLLEEKDGR